MNKDYHYLHMRGNFKDFIKEFNKYNWRIEYRWKYSFFSKLYEGYDYFYIHADIIRFKGVSMILDPISYLRFVMWRRKEWNRRRKVTENDNI